MLHSHMGPPTWSQDFTVVQDPTSPTLQAQENRRFCVNPTYSISHVSSKLSLSYTTIADTPASWPGLSRVTSLLFSILLHPTSQVQLETVPLSRAADALALQELPVALERKYQVTSRFCLYWLSHSPPPDPHSSCSRHQIILAPSSRVMVVMFQATWLKLHPLAGECASIPCASAAQMD